MPVINYERPYLYKKQEDAIFCNERYAYIEASTKAGKTVGCIAWLVEQALLNGGANKNYWWVAPTRSQAKIAYDRMFHFCPKGALSSNLSDLFHEFPNGSRIFFKTAEKPDHLYGEDVYAAVLDEASRCRYDSWVALRSTLTATRGRVRLIANVIGKNNWFYIECRAVQRGRENAVYHKITALDAVEAGVLDAEEIEDAKRLLPDGQFKELYMAEAMDDDQAFIPSDAVERAISASDVYPRGARIIGADPSQGKRDSAAFAFRQGNVVEKIEEHKGMDEIGFKGHLIRLIETWKPDIVFVDGTGFGSTIVKDMWEMNTSFQSIIKPINFASSSLYPDEYVNKRAEMWGEMRKWLIDQNDPVKLPDDEGLAVELTCIARAPHSSGRLLLESKEDLKARGYESPNKADAVALTFAEPVQLYTHTKINYPQQRMRRVLA